MDLTNLHAFIGVAELASFSLAAERLHLTQPAISKRIAALELDLGVRLFDRIGRRTRLTEAGLELLPRARKILLELEDTRRSLGNLSERVSGSLSVATSHHIGLHRLPTVLRRFVRLYPEVNLNLRFLDSESACQAVMQGELELGIVTLPDESSDPLELTPVWNDPMAIVVGKTHPLARLKDIHPEQFAAFNALLPTRGTYTRNLIDASFAAKGVELQVALETNYLETLKMLASVGIGWSVLPETMLGGGVRAVSASGFSVERRLGVVRHPRRTISNAARALIEECVKTATPDIVDV